MSNLTKPEIGTIIHGTLREQDLIPAFIDTLADFDADKVAKIVTEYGSEFVERCSQPSGLDYPTIGEIERRAYLMFDLFDALGEIAPEGAYFGAIEGDGSDIGFWQIEEEE